MNRTKEITFQNGKISLSGSLVLGAPEQRSVVVLMLHGSGPLDRDGNMRGQKSDIFSLIAAAFGQAGISSFRYDKRGCGQSGGAYDTAGLSDLVNDAGAAVDMLAAMPDIDGVILLGHSEGTMVAPVVAHDKDKVVGLILLCPTIQPVEQTLMRQADHMADMIESMPGLRGIFTRLFFRMQGGVRKSQRKLIDRIKVSGNDNFRWRNQLVPTKMLKELLAHDPKSWIAKLRMPVLAISGAKDIQCLPNDPNLIKQTAAGPVESHCVSDLTHILRADDAPASFDRYNALMNKELDPRVPELCVSWIVKQGFGPAALSRRPQCPS